MKPEIKPSLLTPDMVALDWCVSVKTIYGWINSGVLPHVLLPSKGTRKRLLRIRSEVAQSFITQHEVNKTTQNSLPTPKRRRRSILGPTKGVTALNSLENGNGSQNETTKNS